MRVSDVRPPGEVRELAEKFGIELDQHGFAATLPLAPVETSKPGVYVCGPFASPKDIPETVMEASAGAAKAMALLTEQRGTLITHKDINLPDGRDYVIESTTVMVWNLRRDF